MSTYLVAVNGNAIFHATGRRLRELPFTQDKVLCAAAPQPASGTVTVSQSIVTSPTVGWWTVWTTPR
ncbi:hypothetical protein B0I33_11044 [Prauserella shujinwangii]|uniref:Uncharacterized protein n=1 Tax=Prauserella shujinwangii TaxID=1453103 RepID=A0A2T0LP45_9PSEU|nr:hypothetical protein [Prauserella shujinwangii]PRX44946.1 hypothetical protein B0I33_11044 [Prauserella shujinwangii]